MSRKKKNGPVSAASFKKNAKAAQYTPPQSAPSDAGPSVPDFSVPGPWYLRTLTLSLLGAILFFFSFSPYGFSGFGWIATIPFLILIRQTRLLGKRPYRAIWFAAALAWLALLEGVRRPFWALYFGWFALSVYAAAYIPLFVGASRILVHRWRWPLAVAAPVVWIGLELARGYLFSGFSVGLLAHTQFQNPLVIQIADLFGQCGVSFLVVAPAAAIVGLLPQSWLDGTSHQGDAGNASFAPQLICAIAAVALLAGSLSYGSYRLRETDEIATEAETLKVALIQGNVDVVFGGDSRGYLSDQWRQCRKLTSQVRDQHPDTNLVVWPESCFLFGGFDVQVTSPLEPPPDFSGTPQEFEQMLLEQNTEPFLDNCQLLADRFNRLRDDNSEGHAKFLVGSGSAHLGPGDKEVGYNSAIFIDDQGAVEARYFKMHRVMFGEYIPIIDLFPILYRFTPLPAAIRPGDKPTALRVKNWVLCPNICFESTVPQLLRRQSHNLASEGAPVDAFVNVTNDGWFWGSGVQDLHLHCAIFRAVENRRAVVVAANSGFAVHCDAAGRIRALGKRRTAEALTVTISKDNRRSAYHQWGDWPVSNCLLIVLAAFTFEFLLRRDFFRRLIRD
jgi:apolipoprotein N-acyltransferase